VVQFIARTMVISGNSADDELKDGFKDGAKGQSGEGVEQQKKVEIDDFER